MYVYVNDETDQTVILSVDYLLQEIFHKMKRFVTYPKRIPV